MMNKKLSLYITLLNCLFLYEIKAQIVVSGFVKDTANTPVPFANVFVKQSDTSAIIAFSNGGAKGYYSFEMPQTDNFFVYVSVLGFETKAIRIENNTKNALRIDFNLSPKELVLKETIVRGNSRVVQRNDTITFNADKFRDSTERNLEELLTKIPGLDVDKNTGVILVQGKPIKKILIDGDDLTGHNYQLLSKNMSADVVDKIQVIDRFMENKLLKGLKRSEDKVINITLKGKHKKMLFGNLIGGIGNDNRTNNSLNLFGFYNKLKTISFGNFNTIGQVSTADQLLDGEFIDETESESQRSLLKSRNSAVLNVGRTPSVSLSSQSVRFNQAALGSTHFIIRPTEKMNVKGVLTFSRDKVKSFINNDFTYFINDSILKISEQNQLEQCPVVWEGHIDVQYDVTAKSILRYRIDARKSQIQNIATTISNGNDISNVLNDNGLSFANRLDFTHRINDEQALTIHASMIQDVYSQQFQVRQQLPRLIPSVLLYADQFTQSVEKPLQYYALNTQWLFSKNTFKLAVSMGSTLSNEYLKTNLDAVYRNKLVELPDSLKNDLKLAQNNHYIGLNLKEEWLGVQWFSDISGGIYQTNIADKKRKPALYALPILGFKHKFKEFHTIFGTYSYNYALPQAIDISNGLILKDYRSLDRGSVYFLPAHSQTGILNYTYGNFEGAFLAHFNILFTKTGLGYRNDFEVNRDFNITQKVANLGLNQNIVIAGSIEKYIPKAFMRVKLRPSVSIGNYPNTLNNSDIRNTQTLNSQLQFSARSAYQKGFNFHAGSTFSQSVFKTDRGNELSAIRSNSIGSFLDFYLKLNSRVKATIENEFFYVKQQNAAVQRYYFSNASIGYDIIKTRLSANLTARNILNTKEFVNAFASDYFAQINKVSLMPRSIVLELNLRF
jgi:CarboxypepD_reg-like domain